MAQVNSAATASHVHLDPNKPGVWEFKQSDEAARKASELLQKDQEVHHAFFNDWGHHNHIAHHLLALFGTGAGPASLQKAYDENAHYQRPTLPIHSVDSRNSDPHQDTDGPDNPQSAVERELREDWTQNAPRYLGHREYYPDFLRYFQHAIALGGGGGGGQAWQSVVEEHLFGGTPAAQDLLCRLHSGLLHPLIELMYAIEWDQPALVAAALAQACAHGDDVGAFLRQAEQQAEAKSEPLGKLLDAVRDRERIPLAIRPQDQRDYGASLRVEPDIAAIASRVRVQKEELDERTVEMFNTIVFMASASAFHQREKQPKIDFFLMHHVTSSLFYPLINAQDWVRHEVKVRLLEWKMRLALLEYASRGCPPLSMGDLTSYQPRNPSGKTATELIAQFHDRSDDGHALKLARAAGYCQIMSQKYEDKEWMKIKGKDLWNKVHGLILDSTDGEPHWVLTTGLQEAWKDVPNK